MSDLFGDLESPFVRERRQPAIPPAPAAVTAKGAIAKAVAHMEALTYVRKDAEGSADGAWWPADDWLRAFAMGPRGRDEAARLHRALRRLSPEERRALAEELQRDA